MELHHNTEYNFKNRSIMRDNATTKILFCILAIVMLNLFPKAGAQEGNILQGSGMAADDDSAWTVAVIGRGNFENPTGDQIPEYEFGCAGECTNCSGDVLRVWAAGTGYVNIIFSQEVTLKAGHTYKADGAVKDLGGTLTYWWVQLKISLSGAAPTHENDGIKLMGFNNFIEGCTTFGDGTFAEDACDWYGLNAGENPNLANGIGFVAPDSMGAEFNAHFALVTGLYTDGTPYPYDVIFDEVVLIDSNEAASVGIEPRLFNDEDLLNNYPNPFDGMTTINYRVNERSFVDLTVYNLLGQKVAGLVSEIQAPGSYRADFDASNLPGSVFFCKLKVNDRVITRKMNLLR